jgi:hypothetical protein
VSCQKGVSRMSQNERDWLRDAETSSEGGAPWLSHWELRANSILPKA